MTRPLAIDLFTGLHGWAEGFIAEGWRVIGYDLEDMSAQFSEPKPDHFELILQDVLTLHGSQFKDAQCIVASPPCQTFSFMAMPWSKAKELRRQYLAGERKRETLTALFDACFRIQHEASVAAGRHIPLVVENVRGAQEWVGRSRWNFGSFHLWGDVPALMPIAKAVKVPGFRFDGRTQCFQQAAVAHIGIKAPGLNWSDPAKRGQDFTRVAGRQNALGPGDDGIKFHASGDAWFDGGPALHASKSKARKARKAASAQIAKIPFVLSQYIARTYFPHEVARRCGV